MTQTNWIQEGYARITPLLTCDDIEQTIDFYQKAFGFELAAKMPGPGGKTIHADLYREDARIMLGSADPERGCKSPNALGGSNTLYLYVQDVDGFVGHALNHGAKEMMPVTDMFWGDRCGMISDVDGQVWMIATHVKDIAPEDMEYPCWE